MEARPLLLIRRNISKFIPSRAGWNMIRLRFGHGLRKLLKVRWIKEIFQQKISQQLESRINARRRLYGTRTQVSQFTTQSYGKIRVQMPLSMNYPMMADKIDLEIKRVCR